MNLIYINPINNQQEVLEVNYPNVDYVYYMLTKNYNNDIDIIKILNSILKELDCTKEYDGGFRFMTTTIMYKMVLSDYCYYIVKLNNQFIYNEYIDKIIKRHIDNIVYEHKHPIIKDVVEKKNTKTKKKIIPNKFFRSSEVDMFTGKVKYIYNNPKTGEEIISDKDNLLNELNKKKTKVKKVKDTKVNINNITFNFNIK